MGARYYTWMDTVRRLKRRLATRQSIRVAFVGQRTYFEACALDRPAALIDPSFFDFREGDDPGRMMMELEHIAPHVVIVFKPELIPEGFFDNPATITVGYLTEPLPRGEGSHWDLERRLENLRAIDPNNYDRVIAFDPLIVPAAEAFARIWRSLPLPVSDRYYRGLQPVVGEPRIIFVGRSTTHRERFLEPLKHRYDIVHIAHGVGATELDEIADAYHVGINLHSERYISFENRVCLHLAAGQLVLSERLRPTHGLEPQLDYVEFSTPDELVRHTQRVMRGSNQYWRIRIRGRQKAELFRASRVYPGLIRDLLRDLEAFGSVRMERRGRVGIASG